MRVTLAQFRIDERLPRNLARILSVVDDARPDDWVACPEGALSGYFPERETFLRELDAEAIDRAIATIGEHVGRARCHCLFGTAVRRDGAWHNAIVIQSHSGPGAVYDKVELSALDRRHFAPGSAVPVFTIDGVRFGVQVCRELIFPARWVTLKQKGAEIVFHLTNAIKPHDEAWEHVLIARAIESGIFVCSVNNAAPPQRLKSCLVDPSGRVVAEAPLQTDCAVTREIDLAAVIPNLAERKDY